MTQRIITIGVGLGVVLASTFATATRAQDRRESFPDTKDRGRAAAEFRDDNLHVVAAYYYSQRNHDSRWLLIELAATATREMTIERDDITLLTPEGRTVPLASQRAFMQDHQRTRPLVQNAVTTRHGIGAYFPNREGEAFRFFTLKLENGIVRDFFDINTQRTSWGDLFFASPTGSWDDGTYSLMVEGDNALAVLPIDLE